MSSLPLTARLCACALAVTFAAGCAAKVAPAPPSPAEDAVRLARVVRLVELNRRLIALEVERAGYSQRYGQNHPRMVSLDSQIAVLEAALSRESTTDEQIALGEYGDRIMELRLRIQELFARGRGENHPDIVSARRQLAAVEELAQAHARSETALLEQAARDAGAIEARVELALRYLREGRRADAERALDEALKALRRPQ